MNLSVVRAATTASVAAAITASAAPSLLQRQQQRLSGSPSGIQSLLFAAGLRPTPAQATAVSWILRDGMQHVGKLICSNLGARMDSEPKRWRILADVLYDLDIGLEVLSLLCPHLFLEVAGLGNFAKGMALVAARATRLPIYSSFAKEGNLSDLFAKREAISTVFNVIGMGAWIQLASTICSSIEGKDVIKVSLESSVIPRVQLAEGLLISVDPLCEIDGVPIGPEYCKVFVLKANKPNAVLETTSRCLRTVGEAVGRYILWRSIHVQPF